MRLLRHSLQGRTLTLVGLSTVVILAVLGFLSFSAIQDSIARVQQERLTLAKAVGNYLEYVLMQDIIKLQDAAQLSNGIPGYDGLEPTKRALRDLHLRSVFDDSVFIVDCTGQVTWREPQIADGLVGGLGQGSAVQQALERGSPSISDARITYPFGRALVSILVPIKDSEGLVVGAVGGNVDLTGPALEQIVQPARLGKTGYVEVLDSQGIVLAGPPQELLYASDHANYLAGLIKTRKTAVGRCHNCHEGERQPRRENEMMAFAPLPTIAWGVTVRQSEKEALAPADRLRQRFMIVGVSVGVMTLLLGWGLASSVVRPVRVLTDEAQRLAGGNLDDPVAELGDDEIGRLGKSLDTMRERLRQSISEVTRSNRELEDRVQSRTQELENSRNQLKRVLAKVISAEEEERKRIARELHDETSQEATALMISLDTLLAARDLGPEELQTRIEGSKALAESIVDGVQRMIFDLRPSVLDDLGLASAVRWYAESRLKDAGIRLHLEVEDQARALPAQLEVAVYRAFQEAITNIARHAEAGNVWVGLTRSQDDLALMVDDDGKGFDMEHLTPSPDRLEGLGILGMRERLALVGGRLQIDSQVGAGTRVRIEAPLETSAGGRDGQD